MPLALAAVHSAHPDKMILHIDIHLHRIEVTYLRQDQHLTVAASVTGTDRGLIHLHRQWAEAIGQEFVGSTRFDPFHQAASEQELYDRLPGILYNLQHSPSIAFDMTGGSRTYGLTLTRDLIASRAASVYAEIVQLIEGLQQEHGENGPAVLLYLSHRIARLPGCKETLGGLKSAEMVELEEGAGARGVLRIWPQLTDQSGNNEISYFSSRPLPPAESVQGYKQPEDTLSDARPTHLLYRSLAYPITDKPLTIGSVQAGEPNDINITGPTAGISPEHFTVALVGEDVTLHDKSDQGTYVDEKRVNKSTTLKLGQIIRVGTSGQELHVIACAKLDK